MKLTLGGLSLNELDSLKNFKTIGRQVHLIILALLMLWTYSAYVKWLSSRNTDRWHKERERTAIIRS